MVEHYLAGLATRARTRTVKESRAILERLVRELGVVDVADITRARVKAWRQARIASGASNKTANNQLAVLLAALANAVEDELIERHPLAGMKALPVGPRHQRRRPRALAHWEIAQLLAALREIDQAADDPVPRSEWLTISEAAKLVGVTWEGLSQRAAREGWQMGRSTRRGKPVRIVRAVDAIAAFRARARVPQEPFVRVLLETGARWGELAAATWSDLDLASRTLNLRGETTKTDQARGIPIRPTTCRVLEVYRLACASILGALPAGRDRIFLSPRGKPWTSGANFRKLLFEAYERAGLLVRDERGRLRSRDGYALNIHTLRHTCCTRMLYEDIPVPIVQSMLGHSTPQMTLRVYAHLRGAEAARSHVDALPELEEHRRALPDAHSRWHPSGRAGTDHQRNTSQQEGPSASTAGSN